MMKSTKIISPSISLPLKNALTNIYWKKSDLKSFLSISIRNNSILATLDWNLTKYKIVSELIDRMFNRQDIYKEDLLYLIELICDMDDFTHLLRWDDGKDKVKKAKDSVDALRKNAEGYFTRKTKEKVAAEQRANYQEQILKMQNSSEKLQEMYSKFMNMYKIEDAQRRGYLFEEFLIDIFNFFDLDAKNSFKIDGEQIDGAFSFDGADYLIEAKWTKTPIDKTELSVFHEKIESKLKNTLGLFVSVNGYTETASNSGFRNNNMVLMDGQDIVQILENRISLPDLLMQKRRHAAQTGEIMFRVQC